MPEEYDDGVQPSGDEGSAAFTLSAKHVRTISIACIVAIAFIPLCGISALLFGSDQIAPSVVAIVSTSVAAAGSIASALFSLRAVTETTQSAQRALQAAEENATRDLRDSIRDELEGFSPQDPPPRSLVLRGRRNGISYAEQAELVGADVDFIRKIGNLKYGQRG